MPRPFALLVLALLLTSCRIQTVVGGGTEVAVSDGMAGADLELRDFENPISTTMAAHPAGGLIFLKVDEVIRLRPDGTLEVLATVPLPENSILTDVDVSPEGDIFVLRTNRFIPSALVRIVDDTELEITEVDEFLTGLAIDAASGVHYVAVDTDFDFRADIMTIEGVSLAPVPGSPSVTLEFGAPPAYKTFDVHDGVVYAPLDNQVLAYAADGEATVVAGTGESGFGGDGGPAIDARLNFPHAVALFGDEIYIADTQNHRVRHVDAAGEITTVAGTGVPGLSGDGLHATRARISMPRDVMPYGHGRFYVYDSGNRRIRQVDGVASECEQFRFFGVRGSGATTDDEFGYGEVIHEMRVALVESQAGRDVGYTPIDFTAAPVSALGVDPGLFYEGVSGAADLLTAEVRNLLGRCPEVRIVLAGHSQGNMAIREALVNLTSDELRSVAFVALWSDPYRDTTSPYVADDSEENGVYTSLEGPFAEIPEELWDRTVSWCSEFDAVCRYSAENLTLLLDTPQLQHFENYRVVASYAGHVLWEVIDAEPTTAGTQNVGSLVLADAPSAP